ncbi:hypothetical protein Q4566_07210 [Tamlana sp. 2_MG-2023]|uniref:tetratricopeptide repeat protein n=1 Tax=unclassified Tamlana TaxID=2614803 RepID=UPI0026E3982A|nr:MULTISPECIES: hypothetical protein [unclassified Tamlana]MDO6759985.1 hypothetical protein [Tamlana sp. 2_MG-2023]MDO6791845.1 hypothetical protein [Tamlana sp. 1_MG-2023]
MYRKIFLLLCLLSVSLIYAHGSLTKRIKEKSIEIRKQPKNPKLYFERGYLYEQHEEFNKAIKDYSKSEKLGNSEAVLYYRKAQTYYHSGHFSKALKASNKALVKDGLNVKLNKLQGEILIQLGAYQEALKYYRFFIENTVDTNPEDYIVYSSIFLGIDSSNYEKAIQILDAGLIKIGKGTFTLQLKKLKYLEASSQVNKVIEQYNYFILSAYRKEFWYYKKAKYLFENKKILDCKIAIQQAQTAIVLLPDKFKNTSGIKNLENEINKLKKELSNEN